MVVVLPVAAAVAVAVTVAEVVVVMVGVLVLTMTSVTAAAAVMLSDVLLMKAASMKDEVRLVATHSAHPVMVWRRSQ